MRAATDDLVTPKLHALRSRFQERGFDIRFVGGCVRDLLAGENPKDIDLCTDANPDEQIEIYKAHKIPYYPTGIDHGTVTVSLFGADEVYEITSLRTESEHNGRHANCTWTRCWTEDLRRRDLTINAMLLTFENELFDPFGGSYDLENRRVVFVGDPGERIREDYLRILRFFRFLGRFGEGDIDQKTAISIQCNAGGLRTISSERIWLEMSKILSHNSAQDMLAKMVELGVDIPIGLMRGDLNKLGLAAESTRNPITRLCAYRGSETTAIGQRWRWSKAEQNLGRFLVTNLEAPLDLARAKYLVAVENNIPEHVAELALMHGRTDIADFIVLWLAPKFPVSGFDLISLGIEKGQKVGEAITLLKEAWAKLDYSASKADLLAIIEESTDVELR